MASDITKSNIRAIIKNKLKTLSKEEIKQKSKEIVLKLLSHSSFKRAIYVFSYVSFRDEVVTHELIMEMLQLGKKVIVPRCDLSCEEIQLVQIHDFKQNLEEGAYGILEPKKTLEVFSGSIDVVIAPGMAFDKSGGRLGRGRGYFDKLLKRDECKDAYKIALGFEMQVVDTLVMTEQDVWMNEVITENNNYKR